VTATLPPRHLLLALAVVTVWGTNFSVIKVALDDLPPLTFATLRFTFAFFPLALFLPRPNVPWRLLAAYGVFIGAGQFGLLYIAMQSDISPGLASLVVQTQVFFTIALSMGIAGERVRGFQVVALSLAVAGIAIIALRTGGDATFLGLALTLTAAFSWACGNMVSKRAGAVNMLAFVSWASLFALPPLIVFALVFDGPADIEAGVRAATFGTWAAVAYQSLGNTIFGYGMWSWLLSRHPAATVTPVALLVPIVGMATAWLFLDEALPAWKLAAAGLVIAGLALNTAVPMWRGRSAATEPVLDPVESATPA
jgi:O-acetylserine/cysteine efflux transporter